MADNLFVIEPAAHLSATAQGGVLSTQNGAEVVGSVALSAPSITKGQTLASALAMVQAAAEQFRRYDHVLRTMANDVIRITFRSNAEKAELEKALEEADRRLATLQADHLLALELLKVSHLLCGSLKSRLEKFELLPAETERNFHRAARYISKLKHAHAGRAIRPDGSLGENHEYRSQ